MKYYLTERPVGPGAIPSRAKYLDIVNFDSKKMVEKIGRPAWGYIETAEPLTAYDIKEYELTPEEMKTYWCVVSHVYDDGRTDSAVKGTRKAVSKPVSDIYEGAKKDTYIDWYDSKEAAEAFVKSVAK